MTLLAYILQGMLQVIQVITVMSYCYLVEFELERQQIPLLCRDTYKPMVFKHVRRFLPPHLRYWAKELSPYLHVARSMLDGLTHLQLKRRFVQNVCCKLLRQLMFS